MATIAEDLKKIRTAQYGRDMRAALADAIQQLSGGGGGEGPDTYIKSAQV